MSRFDEACFTAWCFLLLLTHGFSINNEDFATIQTKNTITKEHQKLMLQTSSLVTLAYQQPCVQSIPGCTMCIGISNCCAAPTTSSLYGYCATFNKYNCPDGTKAPCDQGNCPGNHYMTCNYVTVSTNTTNAWGSIGCTDASCAAYTGNFCFRAGAQINPSDFLVCNMLYTGNTVVPTTVPTRIPTTLTPTTFKPSGNPSVIPTPVPTQYMPNMEPSQNPVSFGCNIGYYVTIATNPSCQVCPAGDQYFFIVPLCTSSSLFLFYRCP